MPFYVLIMKVHSILLLALNFRLSYESEGFERVTIEEYPFIVSILVGKRFEFTATLLSPR